MKHTSRTRPLVFGVTLVLMCIRCGSSDDTDVAADEETANDEQGDDDDVDDSGSGESAGLTADILCDYSQSVFNDDPLVNATSTSSWTCEDELRSLSANGIPNHYVGVTNNNVISEQEVEVTFSLSPEVSDEGGSFALTAGYALNGIKFEVGTAGLCVDDSESREEDCDSTGRNGGAWNMEALGPNAFDFGTDESNAHVQPTGAYHYHGIPELLLEILNDSESITLVGWASDGFPLYARYGYEDPSDPTSAVVAMASGYEVKETPDENRPSVDVFGMGAFTQDHEFTGSGDLDECNGRFGVTPEFPDGVYHYYVSDDFPFGPRCLKGEFERSRPGGP